MLDEADVVMDRIQDGYVDDNVRAYGVSYNGSSYKAAAVVDKNGFVDKIIQAKE